MEELKYSQVEMLELINQYNATDRKIIKNNLIRIQNELDIKTRQIIELGYASPNVYAWKAPTTNNIPMLDQALTIAIEFDFDVREFLKDI